MSPDSQAVVGLIDLGGTCWSPDALARAWSGKGRLDDRCGLALSSRLPDPAELDHRLAADLAQLRSELGELLAAFLACR